MIDVLTSAVTGFEKPHPAMYAAALTRTRGGRVWMAGDNPDADVAGARAAGIPALLVRDRPGDDLLAAARLILGG
ncbi:HAD family hydrolase [Winogradskya humida]|uniref:HAD-hyrolase-like protein n=1 Tax=Winogradskya humida TaxID=113566 RepID=A0ABQ3ZHD6_9ACTN|nr:HAD-IA family hydrolase [Actinoplanes humidus]GIE17924.1 hypothetical protein Ahu01nite_010260 [Actinoplanes humidus]